MAVKVLSQQNQGSRDPVLPPLGLLSVVTFCCWLKLVLFPLSFLKNLYLGILYGLIAPSACSQQWNLGLYISVGSLDLAIGFEGS